VQPAAEHAIRQYLAKALAACPAAAAYAEGLHAAAGVRLRDLLDHVTTPDPATEAYFAAAGWLRDDAGILVNPSGSFPAILPGAGNDTIWFRVEAVEPFLASQSLIAQVEGAAHGPVRRAIVFTAPGGPAFGVIERGGHIGYDVPETPAATILEARLVLQRFRARRRWFDTVEHGLAVTEAMVDHAVSAIGPHWACALWLRAEREYWMSRCGAARVQKARQDAAGIGWANIDHHTYDGARAHFRHTIRILGKLGYELREMLYAGELAGWGSQVLEQPALGSTIFADVDLAPDELDVDFAHEVLPDLPRHRRAGLVSALHGESILQAGLNHVAGLFDQQALRAQLARAGISMMKPFSAMPHLYQELTEGERAAVDPAVVDGLVHAGHILEADAEDIRLNGAIVSHLENIERNDGFKGFNKPGIDKVLRELDPRAGAKAA
jgi:hypothetical protein